MTAGARKYGALMGHEGDPDCSLCARFTSRLRMDETEFFRQARKSARRGAATADLDRLRQDVARSRAALDEHIGTHADGAA